MKSFHWMVLSCAAVLAVLWWYLQRDRGETETGATKAPVVIVTEAASYPDPQTNPAQLPQPAVVSSSAATVVAPVKKSEVNLEWERELIASLIVMGDADSLMAAALILHELYGGDPGELAKVPNLLARAYRLVPGDRTIVATALRVCRPMRSCDASRYGQATRNIDPNNALGPLPELLFKIESASPGEVTEALQSLARLRLNLYNADLLSRIARAISGAPTTPRSAPANGDLLRMQSELTLRVVAAIEVPSYLTLGSGCQASNWRNRYACEVIARALGQNELIELQRLGIGIAENSTRTPAKRDSDLEQAESYLNWLGSRMAQRPPPAEKWLALLVQHRTEVAASRAWLEQDGVTQPKVPWWIGGGR